MERTAFRSHTAPVSGEAGSLNRDVQGGATRRQRLKEATSDVHRRLDKSLMQRGYFSNPKGFGLYLRRMYQFHLKFEDAALTAGRDWYEAWGLHHHKEWIEADLKKVSIGLTAKPEILTTDTLCVADRSSLAGALYVIAGSSLGARVLHRLSVERRLPGPSGSYYLSQLAASLRWSEFLAFLEDADIACELAMLEGAISTFECVSRHLDPAVPE